MTYSIKHRISTTFVVLTFLSASRIFAQDASDKIPAASPTIVSTFTAAPGAKYPFRENMYEPLLLPDGRILALSVARTNGQQTMQGRYSNDEGRTWTSPVDLFQFPREAGGFAIFNRLIDRNGDIHIFILGDANSGTLYPASQEAPATRPGTILETWYVKSSDHMQHWSTPRRISEHGDDLLSVIQLRSGRIVLPLSFQRIADYNAKRSGLEGFTYYGSYGVTSLYSDDDGDTWNQSPDVLTAEAPDLSTYGLNEPVAIQLNDGRVWMLMRSQYGRFFDSYSPDGAHWSPAEPTDLISSDSPAALLRLKDGSILLFSNACLRYPYAYGGREVLHGAISTDEGKTWRGFREILRDPLRAQPRDFHGDYGYSYTFPVLTAQGNVLFTNWVEPDCGQTRTFKLLDPNWLLQTHQETDFSNGLDDWSTFGTKGVEWRQNPDNKDAHVLSVQRADTAWPAAAIFNFPMGSKGTLKIRLQIRSGFQGAQLGLTDHFSVPWDNQDKFFNAFNLQIDPSGRLSTGQSLSTDQWHDLQFSWDSNTGECQITVDGNQAGFVQENRRPLGINYLRIRSTSDEPDAGLLVSHVTADVSN